MLREKYAGKKIFIFCHSFGSFIGQCFIEKYGALVDGCILSGSAGPRRVGVFAAETIARAVCLLAGGKKKARLLNFIALGLNNARIKNPLTPYDWISRSRENVATYAADPWCGFRCTNLFFKNLFSGLRYVHSKKNIKKIPLELPVFLLAGTDDPVGGYSKTVRKLYETYGSLGMGRLELKLYEKARHVLLDETNRDEAERDILFWYDNLAEKTFAIVLDENTPTH